MEISCESKYVLWHNRSIRPRWLWTSVCFLAVSRTDTSEMLRCKVHAPLFLHTAKTAAIDDGSIHGHLLCLLLVSDSHSPPWLNNFRAKVERITPAPCPRQLNFTAPIHVQKLISLALASQHTFGYNQFLEPSLSARALPVFSLWRIVVRATIVTARDSFKPRPLSPSRAPWRLKSRPAVRLYKVRRHPANGNLLLLPHTPRWTWRQPGTTKCEPTVENRLCPRLCLVETARRQASLKEKQQQQQKSKKNQLYVYGVKK